MADDDLLDSDAWDLSQSVPGPELGNVETNSGVNLASTAETDDGFELATPSPISHDNEGLQTRFSAAFNQVNLKAQLARSKVIDQDMPRPNPSLAEEDHLLTGVPTPGYTLLELPILGGMGCVYKAWNSQLERVVALKLSRKDKGKSSVDDALDSSLRTEAANLARIDHPSIAACYGYGRFGTYSFFEMQWIEGITLDDFIKNAFEKSLQNALGEDELIPWMLDMVESLIFAQLRGIHHQDLKPQNVMLTPKRMSGSVSNLPTTHAELKTFCKTHDIKIMDFGLAQRSSHKRASKSISGTPSYMAPEQMLGQVVDPMHVDMFCLGGIFYTSLTGKRPNQLSLEEIKEVYRSQDSSKLSNRVSPRSINAFVTRDLEAITLKCLSESPSDRYQSLDGLYEDLRSIPQHLPIAARQVSIPEKMTKYVRRHPFAVTFIGFLIAALGTTATLATWLSTSYEETKNARQSDRQTFEQAIEAVATLDNEFLNDVQLNRPENRQLAIRFKLKLFELYQLLNSRPHLEEADRRKLAETSARLAVDQRERGDYELAVNFYSTTLSQYEQLLNGPTKQMSDRVSHVSTLIDLCNAKSRLSRDLYPTEVLQSEMRTAIEQANQLRHCPTQLDAISSYCMISYALQGRAGARKVVPEGEEAYSISTDFVPQDRREKIIKARSLSRLGLVFYKAGCPLFPECFEEAIALYEELNSTATDDANSMAREYAGLISNSSMATLGKLRRALADLDNSQLLEGSEVAPLQSKIEFSYLKALSLLDRAQRVDPLNNLTLRSRISIHWNLADYYHVISMSRLGKENLESEQEHREQCIRHSLDLIGRQPLSVWATHTMTLQLFRLAICNRMQGDDEAFKENFATLMKVDSWSELPKFELSDKANLIHVCAEELERGSEAFDASSGELELAAEIAIKHFVDAGYTPENRFPVHGFSKLKTQVIQEKGPSWDSFGRSCELLVRLFKYDQE